MLMQQVLENKESLCTLILLLFICLVSTFEHEYVILYYISIIIPECGCVYLFAYLYVYVIVHTIFTARPGIL